MYGLGLEANPDLEHHSLHCCC